MNANLITLISGAAATLAMSSNAFAAPSRQVQMKEGGCTCTPFEQSTPLTECQSFPPAYNAAARPEVRCSWDIFVTGSFLYWFTSEEGLDVGYTTAISGGDLLPPDGGRKTFQSGKFIPGFKAGLGLDFGLDKWVGYLEYTWLHGAISQSLNAGDDSRGTGTIVLGTWYNQQTASALDHTATDLYSKWKVKLDILDATLSRPYYEGRNLTITPFFGARALWLRQNFRITATTTNQPTENPVVSHNQSRSWAFGPRGGMQSHWLLGLGFRLEGDAGAALLFQRYTKVAHRSDALNDTLDGSADQLYYKNYDVMRPIMDMGLGIGWGTYLDCQNFYLDIAANYDFIYLWGQNVMRHLVDDYNYGVDGAPADLFYNGLTLTVRFDF